MQPLILTVDQSTSTTKAILFDTDGQLLHRVNKDHTQYYPQPGWVEHDPLEIWRNTLLAIDGVLRAAGVGRDAVAEQIKVLALTNQRETVLIWDRASGEPVCPAITWQCRRAADICKAIEATGQAEDVRRRTGLVLSPYFSAAKARWILEQVPGALARAEEGQLLLGTMDSWLIWKLTGGTVHATDYSNASRTQLFNVFDCCWDKQLLALFGIPPSLMPQVLCSDEIFGRVARTGDPLQDQLAGLPISGVMGDSHAALFGQNGYSRGMAKATYGTGSSIMMNIGPEPRLSQNGLVTSLAWGMQGSVAYVFEGNINCTGATIKWLVDDLQLIGQSRDAGPLAASLSSNDGVYLVPAFVGLGAPYWDSDARASITGMTRSTGRAHLVRAAEESIAYQIKDVVDLMMRDSGITIPELRVDGGPTRDEFLMQFQADMLGLPVACARIEELSALGSCLMAGLAVGIWRNLAEVTALRQTGQTYRPQRAAKQCDAWYQGWRQAVSRTLSS
jgi:glycerol kinase